MLVRDSVPLPTRSGSNLGLGANFAVHGTLALSVTGANLTTPHLKYPLFQPRVGGIPCSPRIRDGGARFRALQNPAVWGLGFRVWGLEFGVQGSGFRVQGSGFRVQGSGFRAQGLGCRL
ncbi:hypothetical protein T484DRAFT_1645345 [Baffinella frigidus]|nr:hypothetical protein T484DRAFT_1645345 [Cryptophyta sp. CCMP2293]